MTKGAVAAGHPETAAAAAEVLQAGGTAFDAVIAALAVSFVVEPALSSPGGGGFLMALPAGGGPIVLDFFAQTPGRRPPPSPPGRPGGLDFHATQANFGPATQGFHIGRAAVAVPGMIPGLCALHRTWARLPLARLLEPAVLLARAGPPLAPLQAHILEVIAPILLWSPEAAACFGDPDRPGRTRAAGCALALPALADCLEALGREGERLFRDGPVGQAMAALAGPDQGGLMTLDDLIAYQVLWHPPLERPFAGARVWTNPPPSSGGALMSFGLALAETMATAGDPPDPVLLAGILHRTGLARDAAGLHHGADDARVAHLLSAPDIARWRADLGAGRPLKTGGTTHVSVVDAQGNACACTVSNGEGCGHMVPGCGFMLNNMLGEEDLNPLGFFRWAPGMRVSSMMAPTLARRADGRLLALGSGGSNRIRTALLQVIWRLLLTNEALDAAVAAPRLHVERDHLDIEAGWPPDAVSALCAGFPDARVWPDRSMFFGGVHGVQASPCGRVVQAAGDPRRGGAARCVG